MNKTFIDLHVHSTFSDGYQTIAELIHMAKENNVRVFSICDHDDVRNFELLKSLVDKYKLKTISAVELSTYYFSPVEKTRKKVHLLGYGIDIYNSAIVKQMQVYKCARYRENIKMLNNLIKNKIDVPDCIFDEVKFENYLSIVSEMKRVLVKNDYDYEYVHYFVDSVKPFVPKYQNYEMNIIDAIRLIIKAGGTAVLAHPQEIKMNYDDKELLIKQLKDEGLLGIEVFHADASEVQMLENQKLATDNNMLVSVGSDYHRPDRNNKTIGSGINNNLLKTSCSLVDYFEDNNML